MAANASARRTTRWDSSGGPRPRRARSPRCRDRRRSRRRRTRRAGSGRRRASRTSGRGRGGGGTVTWSGPSTKDAMETRSVEPGGTRGAATSASTTSSTISPRSSRAVTVSLRPCPVTVSRSRDRERPLAPRSCRRRDSRSRGRLDEDAVVGGQVALGGEDLLVAHGGEPACRLWRAAIGHRPGPGLPIRIAVRPVLRARERRTVDQRCGAGGLEPGEARAPSRVAGGGVLAASRPSRRSDVAGVADRGRSRARRRRPGRRQTSNAAVFWPSSRLGVDRVDERGRSRWPVRSRAGAWASSRTMRRASSKLPSDRDDPPRRATCAWSQLARRDPTPREHDRPAASLPAAAA